MRQKPREIARAVSVFAYSCIRQHAVNTKRVGNINRYNCTRGYDRKFVSRSKLPVYPVERFPKRVFAAPDVFSPLYLFIRVRVFRLRSVTVRVHVASIVRARPSDSFPFGPVYNDFDGFAAPDTIDVETRAGPLIVFLRDGFTRALYGPAAINEMPVYRSVRIRRSEMTDGMGGGPKIVNKSTAASKPFVEHGFRGHRRTNASAIELP